MLIDYRTVDPRHSQEEDLLICRFDGMEHFLCVGERTLSPGEDRRRASRRASDKGWFGTSTYGDSLLLARKGWPEGERAMEKFLPEMMSWFSEHTQRDRWLLDVEGEEIDVPRMLNGEPECWRHRQTTSGKRRGRKYIHIVVNCAVSCAVAGTEVAQRGACIAGFIATVERVGYQVQLTVIEGIRSGPAFGRYLALIVPVKDYNDRFDLPSLVYPLSHPSMLRRQMFAAKEMLPPAIRTEFGCLGGDYGFPARRLAARAVPDAHIALNMKDEITPQKLLYAAKTAGFIFTREAA